MNPNDLKYFNQSCARLRNFFFEAKYVVGEYDSASISLLMAATPADFLKPIVANLPESLDGYFRKVALNNKDFGMELFFYADGKIEAQICASEDYPDAWLILSMILQNHLLLPSQNFLGETNPLSYVWLKEQFMQLRVWSYKWMNDHKELLPESLQ